MSKQGKATRFVVFTGVLSALAIILYFFEFPIIPGVSYLSVDLGDLPAAIAGVMMGPLAAVAVEFIKVLIHVVVKGFGSTMGFGDLINFLVGIALTVPFSAMLRFLLRKQYNRYLSILISGIAAMASMCAAGVIGNYLIAPPYFEFVVHFKLTGTALWAAIGSATILNVIKSALIAVLMVPVMAAMKNQIFRTKAL